LEPLVDDLAQPLPGALPSGGQVRPITRWGSPVLHRKLHPVTAFDDHLRSLVADMVATMYAAEGVGLAANQIGEEVAVFVFDCPDDDGRREAGVVCNPVVEVPEGSDRRLDDGDEGCLSLPGAFVECPRSDSVRVTGSGLDGSPVSYEGTGLLARCLQHEADHLAGTVFGDRIGRRARKRLYRQAEELENEFPPDWPVSPRRPSPDAPS
jgi:peptide deformylase